MREQWVEIESYPRYELSNYGQVLNIRTEKLLKPRINHLGYVKVALSNVDGVRDWYIHQLLARAFFHGFRPGLQVIHVDGNNENNRLDNLRLRRELDYPDDPVEHRDGWGRRVYILETGEVFRTVRDCARYIGGDYGCIYAVLRGERKQHLGYTFGYWDA